MRLVLVLVAAWYVFSVLAAVAISSATCGMAWTFWSSAADVFGG